MILVMNLKVGDTFLYDHKIYQLVRFAPGKAVCRKHMFLQGGNWRFYTSPELCDIPLSVGAAKVKINLEVVG